VKEQPMNRLIMALPVLAMLTGTAVADTSDAWSGAYAGIALGLSAADTTIVGNRFTYNQNQAVNRVEHAYSGVSAGGTVGWNARRDAFVYGGALAFRWDDLNSDLVFNTDNDIDQVDVAWSGAFTLRAGVVHQDALIYALAGVAFARINNLGGDVNGGALTESDAHRRSDTYYGPIVGIGIEHLLSGGWSAKLELTFEDYDSYSQANQDGVPGSQVYQVDNGPIGRLAFGLVYNF
jgi:hypothetical protein